MDGITEVPVQPTCRSKCRGCWHRFRERAGWEMFRKGPNDLRAAMVILFLESLAMFNFFNVLMWILTEDAHFSDRAAGWIFGTYGFSVSLFSVLLGPVVDRLQVRKTLILHIALGLLSKVILAFTLHPIAVCVVLYGPLSICMALGVPVVPVALRRYTRIKFHTLAFAAHYVIMNVGAALSQPIVDGFRLGVAPYSGAPWMLHRPVWSFFLLCNALFHVATILIAYVWIRDVEVVEPAPQAQVPPPETTERWETQPVPYGQRQTWTQFRAKMWKIFRGGMLWRFVALSISLVGAKSVFVYLISLYPVYMKRAPFPVAHPEQMPFMTFLIINPIIVIAVTYPFGALMTHFGWDRFWVIVVGTILSAGAPFFMMIPQYWAVFCFITLMSIAEPIWSPVYNKYTLEFTQKGEEGIFFGLSTIPLFVGKLLTGFMSGELLHRYCPAPGIEPSPNGCGQGWLIWLIIGCTTLASPLALIVNQRWTWLRRDDAKPSVPLGLADDAVQMMPMDGSEEDLFEGVLDEDEVEDFA